MQRPTLSPRLIVAIGDKLDAHLPFVEPHLSLPLVVVDVAAMMTGENLSYATHKGKLRTVHNDRPLDNVGSVWLRGSRSREPLTIPTSSFYQEYAKSATTRHAEALYSQLADACWVSDFYAIKRAEYKPLQLQLALRLGFKVPDTLFTSSPAQAKKFIDKYRETIVKPVGAVWPRDKEKSLIFMFYSTKIHRDEAIDLSGLPLAPAIFQKAIDAVADLRVTVIGDKVFSTIIMNEKFEEDSPTRDWRAGDIAGKMKSYKLPKDITDKCLALVKELGLKFGAIDLVLDKKGEIWFLENNANGQWAFVEEETGQPLGKAMADLLQGKS